MIALGLAILLAAGAPEVVRLRPEEVRWREIPGTPGVRQAVLFGDPGKPGLYVIRVRFPPHVMDAPHSHSKDRYVTVMEGTWATGAGPIFDPAAAKPLAPGSMMMHPAGALHWDGSATDAPVVVQITGEGPVDTTPANPAGRQWVDVRR